jgi:hypothetical protein
MQAADIDKSDLDFAGLMLRCNQADLDLMIVLITPLPPRSRPRVTLISGANKFAFEGTVLSPGAAILLPSEAGLLVKTTWASASQVAVEVQNGETEIRGQVPLGGLTGAVSRLRTNCPRP